MRLNFTYYDIYTYVHMSLYMQSFTNKSCILNLI